MFSILDAQARIEAFITRMENDHARIEALIISNNALLNRIDAILESIEKSLKAELTEDSGNG